MALPAELSLLIWNSLQILSRKKDFFSEKLLLSNQPELLKEKMPWILGDETNNRGKECNEG
jgi:hypothetical protein